MITLFMFILFLDVLPVICNIEYFYGIAKISDKSKLKYLLSPTVASQRSKFSIRDIL